MNRRNFLKLFATIPLIPVLPFKAKASDFEGGKYYYLEFDNSVLNLLSVKDLKGQVHTEPVGETATAYIVKKLEKRISFKTRYGLIYVDRLSPTVTQMANKIVDMENGKVEKDRFANIKDREELFAYAPYIPLITG